MRRALNRQARDPGRDLSQKEKPSIVSLMTKQDRADPSTTEVLQSYLDVVAQSLFDNDFDTYARHVQLPFVLITKASRMTVSEVSELRAGFESYLTFMKQVGLTRMQRIVIDTQKLESGMIAGKYRTTMLNGQKEVMAPFQSMMILAPGENVWQAVLISNEFRNEN